MASKEHSFDLSAKVDIQEFKNALEQAKKDAAPLLVTGSFYLVAEVKKFLQEASNF